MSIFVLPYKNHQKFLIYASSKVLYGQISLQFHALSIIMPDIKG